MFFKEERATVERTSELSVITHQHNSSACPGVNIRGQLHSYIYIHIYIKTLHTLMTKNTQAGLGIHFIGPLARGSINTPYHSKKKILNRSVP